jgi:3-deoxy-7-phosphoheptulonate synthase
MIVAMQDSASEDQIQQVIDHLVRLGFEVHRSTGARQTVLGAVGANVDFDIRNLEVLPGVQEAHQFSLQAGGTELSSRGHRHSPAERH